MGAASNVFWAAAFLLRRAAWAAMMLRWGGVEMHGGCTAA